MKHDIFMGKIKLYIIFIFTPPDTIGVLEILPRAKQELIYGIIYRNVPISSAP